MMEIELSLRSSLSLLCLCFGATPGGSGPGAGVADHVVFGIKLWSLMYRACTQTLFLFGGGAHSATLGCYSPHSAWRGSCLRYHVTCRN